MCASSDAFADAIDEEQSTGPVTLASDIDYEALAGMSLEELMSVRVTSVAGVEKEWFKTPAAMYVIRNDEARRSGYRHLPDLLRLAPGVFVGSVNAQSYGIGTRGFNGGLANKTLVLIDGRSVYDPMLGGTFWDVQDILIEDLDQIEVIRGPGPTLWGANAVNGVFNITTRSAKDTQGFYGAGGGGQEYHAFGEARYGGQIDDSSWFRVWGKYFDRDSFSVPGGGSAHDEWDMARGGFRFDFEDDDGGALMIDSGVYSSDRKGEVVTVPTPVFIFPLLSVAGDGRTEGGHLLLRMSKEYDERSGWSFQGYYDRANRVQSAGFQSERDTFDAEFRHYFPLWNNHDVIWGLGFRHNSDTTEDGPTVLMLDRDRTLRTFSAFIQDTITLAPDTLFAMIGTKLEHNDVSGFEVQPSGRIWWTPNDDHTLWGAISRPVRVPSRLEEDGAIGIPGIVGVTGNRGVEAEELLAYEVGYRIRATPDLIFDATLFYNDYEDLISVPPTILLATFGNEGTGESYGGELTVTWQPAENLRVVGGYSFARVLIHGPVFNADEDNTPRHMAQLRAYLDVTKDIELNGAIYYVDTMPGGMGDADPYLRLDLGMTWRLTDNFEVSAYGMNLLDPRHREFSGIEVDRGFYVMAAYRF